LSTPNSATNTWASTATDSQKRSFKEEEQYKWLALGRFTAKDLKYRQGQRAGSNGSSGGGGSGGGAKHQPSSVAALQVPELPKDRWRRSRRT
jgi:hypothetical protein